MKLIKNPVLVGIAIISIAAAAARSQTADKQPTQLQVSVGDVTDSRTTGHFNAECKVELKFSGDAAMDAGKVRRVHVTTATDELGHDLVPKEDNDMRMSSFDFDSDNGVKKAEVKLRNPSRNAASIKILAGEVEFFNPTAANGGLITIKDFLKKPGEAVQNPALAKYNVQLTCQASQASEAKNKVTTSQPKSGEGPGDIFGGMFSGMMGGDSPNTVKVQTRDPENHIVELEFLDGQGKPLHQMGSMSMNDNRRVTFDSPPPPDTQVIVKLATPESLKSYPFKLENIPLP